MEKEEFNNVKMYCINYYGYYYAIIINDNDTWAVAV